MRAISHKNAAEKTMIILVLAEALRAAALVGDPAPQVARLWDWMSAPLRVGDLVVETSTGHRGPDPSRVGVVLKISRHRSPYERVTEILLLDPPCGKTRCRNQKCIHRRRWNNAAFVRVPETAAQLTQEVTLIYDERLGYHRTCFHRARPSRNRTRRDPSLSCVARHKLRASRPRRALLLHPWSGRYRARHRG